MFVWGKSKENSIIFWEFSSRKRVNFDAKLREIGKIKKFERKKKEVKKKKHKNFSRIFSRNH